MECKDCKFWMDFYIGTDDDEDCSLGNCKRFPPAFDTTRTWAMDGEENTDDWRNWNSPVTRGHDWCGEFKPSNS
jgi:hypothetical protein